MRSLLVWRSIVRARNTWVGENSRIGEGLASSHAKLHPENGKWQARSINSSASLPDWVPYDKGAATLHAAERVNDAESFKAAVEDCMQQAQNLLAHARQAAWTAESLKSSPAEPEPIAKRKGLPPHSQPPTSAPRAVPQPRANLRLQDAAKQVSAEEHTELVRSHASLYKEHTITLARLNSLQSEREAADSDRSTALAQLVDLRIQHTNAETELGAKQKQVHSLLQEIDEVWREYSAMLGKLEALKAQVQSHEGLEAEYEKLLSANGTIRSEHELLQADHKELTHEHAALTRSFQQVNNQCEELEQEVQELLARQDAHELAQKQHSAALDELDETHRAYSADLHRLQEEVLRLEDSLQAAKMEHKDSKAALEEQLWQAGKRQSADYSEYMTNLQELEEVEAKWESVKRENRSLQAQSGVLQHRLQHSEDCNSSLQRRLEKVLEQLGADGWKLQASDSRCIELEQKLCQSREAHSDVESELALLQADLKKLHDLAADNRLTAEDLHQMFAQPVSSEGTTSHSLPASSAASATASTAAATAADGSHRVGGVGADKPLSDEPGFCNNSPPGVRKPSQPTSHAEPRPIGTPEAENAASGSVVSTTATSPGHFGSSGAAAESDDTTGTEPRAEQSNSDGEGVCTPIEDISLDQRAAVLQEQLTAHHDLKLTTSLDIGAKAYASSAPEHCFSTQEVILSMLQHDQKFLQLLDERSHEAGIDPISLELAVADSYRSLLEREQGRSGAGRRTFTYFSRLPVNCPNLLSLPGIRMIIPNDYAKVDQLALEALYQYWGIVYVRI